MALVVLPVGLGLVGFVEPCTVGSSLLFVKYLEGKGKAAKLAETLAFAATRALFIGALGALAALVGAAFLDLQRFFWVALGILYIALGALYLSGKQGFLMRTLGLRLGNLSRTRGAATLGVVFGLNVPACAAPLLGAVMAASLGAVTMARGFFVMALFGLALSLPLVLFVLWRRARGWLDRLTSLSARVPFWTGVAFVVLGAWSIVWGVRPPTGG